MIWTRNSTSKGSRRKYFENLKMPPSCHELPQKIAFLKEITSSAIWKGYFWFLWNLDQTSYDDARIRRKLKWKKNRIFVPNNYSNSSNSIDSCFSHRSLAISKYLKMNWIHKFLNGRNIGSWSKETQKRKDFSSGNSTPKQEELLSQPSLAFWKSRGRED